MREGFFKEDEILYHLNNHKIKELNNNLRYVMKVLYGPLDNEEVVTCEKTTGFIKPDIIITYKGIKKAVSIKSGKSEFIHEGWVKDIVLYLRSLGVSKNTQKAILLYQYGDGTLDGSGEPMEFAKVRYLYDDIVREANKELNKDRDFVVSVVSHLMFLGNKENAILVDAIYHGDYLYCGLVK